MSEEDQYEHYNYDPEKHVSGGHSGKGRTKKEAEQHHNHEDTCGHTRKIAQKFINSHEKEKAEAKEKGPDSGSKHHHKDEKVSQHTRLTRSQGRL